MRDSRSRVETGHPLAVRTLTPATTTTTSHNTEQLKRLVEGHFDSFIACKDSIDTIYQKIEVNELSNDGIGTEQLQGAYEGA